jgi:hypothetical protein
MRLCLFKKNNKTGEKTSVAISVVCDGPVRANPSFHQTEFNGTENRPAESNSAGSSSSWGGTSSSQREGGESQYREPSKKGPGFVFAGQQEISSLLQNKGD